MIGYYVHHHGRGHLMRARSVAAAAGVPVTVLSSLPPPARLEPFAGWVQLRPDDDDPARTDLTAGGALHWAPLRAAGYQSRMQQLAAWVGQAQPETFVVDVSVEVTAFVRLLGVPTVVMAGPGQRTDGPHTLGYRLASRIIAPWPEAVYAPQHLRPYAAKVDHVGAFSRFDGRVSAAPDRRTVLVLFGDGGSVVSRADVTAAAQANPDWSWRAFGGGQLPWTDDVWTALQQATVVVSHVGQNAVAEIAAARRPAILIPQPRPFREQEETAAALAAAGLATVRPRWPVTDEWPELLDAAAAAGGAAWSAWNRGDGAERAAAAILGLNDRVSA